MMMQALEGDLGSMTRQSDALGRNLFRLRQRHADWSRRTFGADGAVGPLGPLRHLKLEADEAIASPGDPEEYADCLLLVMDAIRRAGFTLEEVVLVAECKMDILEARSWPAPKDGAPRQHVADPVVAVDERRTVSLGRFASAQGRLVSSDGDVGTVEVGGKLFTGPLLPRSAGRRAL